MKNEKMSTWLYGMVEMEEENEQRGDDDLRKKKVPETKAEEEEEEREIERAQRILCGGNI